eukprot:jgi/Mesvir1/514/Mv11377-RA.1
MVPCNRRFLKPPTCYLPNLGEVAELSVGAPCYSGKTDLDTYYYRFEVPESWRPYFSLPPVWSDERGLSYPMHLMGVRTVRGDGMDRLELVESAASAAWRLLPEDPPHPAQLVMIDDLGVTHGRSAEETNAVLTKACEESYGPKGLVVNEKKVERAEEGRPVEILGIEFCQDGSMRPSAARMAALVRDTQAMLGRGRATYHQLASLLGRWVWVHLLRRGLLSIWFHAYRLLQQVLVHKRGWSYRLWGSVREELQAAMDLAPLVHAQRDQPLSCTVVATDASTHGSGVVYSRWEAPAVRGLSNCRERKGWKTLCVDSETASVERTGEIEHRAMAAAQWRTALAHRWLDPSAHINEKEIRAAVQGIEWGLRSQVHWQQRHVRLVDNSAVVGALVKGRSSSYRLNAWCRRAIALGLASNTRYHWVYVRSERNPADAPSRGRWVRNLTADGDVESNPGPHGRQELLEATVQPSTLAAYHRALRAYVEYGQPLAPVAKTEAEGVFCEWLVSVYEEGGSRTMVVRALCGLQLYFPNEIKGWYEARRLLAGWARRVPVQSPHPVPWQLLYLVANILRAQGSILAACCCIIVFQQYLRIGEAFKLRVGDVALRGDFRLGPSNQGALLLRDPKTAKGQAQAVVVVEPLSLTLLGALCAGRAHEELLFGALSYSRFLRRWHAAWDLLGLRGMFSPYSMRHGGATHDYLRGVPIADIQKRGRWRQFSSVDHYVGLHRALQVRVPQVVWDLAGRLPPRDWRRHFGP